MYDSFCSILTPLVLKKKSGILHLYHENGQRGLLILKGGTLIGLRTETSEGPEAGREMAMWVFFRHEFVTKKSITNIGLKGVNSMKYLALLEKIEKRVITIKKDISLDAKNLQLSAGDLFGEKEFKPDELKVALALDGKTSVKNIVDKTGLADLIVLVNIHKLFSLGLIQSIKEKKKMEDYHRVAFLNYMVEILVEYVGPAAEFLLHDAFETLESTPENIFSTDLPQLVKNIAHHLEPTDSIFFRKKARDLIRQFQHVNGVKQEVSFLDSMTENLTEYLGPAAKFIIIDAFNDLESTPERIYKRELPQIANSISYHLDEHDRLPFKKKAMEFMLTYKGVVDMN